MRQHHKVSLGSNKTRRKKIREKGLEILSTMKIESPVTKRKRRIAFAEARKQARNSM